MMGKLVMTKPQVAVLATVGQLNDRGISANAYGHRLNTGILRRLEQRGLIHSARPVAGQYHSVTITDAGREALSQAKGRTE